MGSRLHIFKTRTSSTLLAGGAFDPNPSLDDIQHLVGEIPERFKADVRAAETKRRWESEEQEVYRRKPVQFLQPDELEASESLHARLTRVGKWSVFHNLTTKQKRQCILDITTVLDRKHTPIWNLDSDPYAQPPHAKISDEELVDFEDLLRKMLKYSPEDRITISQVLGHPWLNKEYKDLDDMNVPWLSIYTTGYQYFELEGWYEEVIVKGGTWQREYDDEDGESGNQGNTIKQDDIEPMENLKQADAIKQEHDTVQEHETKQGQDYRARE